MKNLITYTLAATLAVGATAQHHQHQHIHARRHASSKVQKRDAAVVTQYSQAVEVVYELDGKPIDVDAAKAGLDGGNLVIVGESNPTSGAPAAPETPAAEPKKEVGAQFYESESESQAQSTSAPAPVYTAPAAEPETPKPSKAPKAPKTGGSSSGSGSGSSSGSGSGSSYGGSSGASGVDRKFKSGTVDCSEFPSAYGAVALDWLDLGGWSGIQYVPDFTLSSTSIFQIDTAVNGDGCTKGAMCSYACPAGYQKTQWPKAQGSAKESVGGLYCNSEGKLELTREGHDTLCELGAGGVSIENDLDEIVSTCRTDYPGTENMVIPAIAPAGGSVDVCNPEQEKYYIWGGAGTSAQYYVNPKGTKPECACKWKCDNRDDAGNWAPVVLGVGQASDGLTFISIFQNLPTSTAKLDFNIEIKGDVNSKCSYINGKWTGGATGCTTSMRSGGKAIVRYF